MVKEAPVCGNYDMYVDIRTIYPRKRKPIMICRLNGQPMNPALKAGCPYHPALRKEGILEKWLK